MGYHFIEGISYIKRVADHFGLQKFNLMGHSMGGAMCSVFAATFPNQVKLTIIRTDTVIESDFMKAHKRADPFGIRNTAEMIDKKNIGCRWSSSVFFVQQPTGHWFSCQMGVCHWSLSVAKTNEDQ